MNLFCKGIVFFVTSFLLKDVFLAPIEGDVFNIIGGRDAKKGQVPYQASIRFKLIPEEHYCGGSIIDKNRILTSGYCCEIIDYHGDLKKFYIGAGIINVTDTKRMIKKEIDSFKIHEDYNIKTMENDICLIKIKGSFKFNKDVKMIKANTETVKEGTECQISGWGINDITTQKSPDVLNIATIPISNQNECVANYSEWHLHVKLKSMICAGNPRGGIDACGEDAGGPLVCNKKVTGILSWGRGCGKVGYPRISTRVLTFIDWLKKNGVNLNYINENEDERFEKITYYNDYY